eukprot:TRINITY_DN10031_c0_g1_i1.p1 TRINITY_DN10031_c0_g1~~TRINITY_DN10031_c0_g1_i1.p1  ORF type:complete len:508 (-),score=106.60 TRINITY_DN10031_c0_g1_i1:166-1542(-)
MDIRNLHEIAKKMRSNRFDKGALRLNNPKLAFALDEDGMPFQTFLSEQKEANFLVEEFMLLTNMTVAKIISRTFPECSLLRRHPEPNPRKLKEFEAFCVKHGFELNTSSSGDFNISLEKIREKLIDDKVLYNIIILHATRPMQLAKYVCTGDQRYSQDEWNHYALATPVYTHFTSPIRRYPDILVHRTLAAVLDAEKDYLKWQKPKVKKDAKEGTSFGSLNRVFTGLEFDKDAAESSIGKKALTASAQKHKLVETENLSVIATYCNERRLASRNVKEATDKVYLWALVRRKQILVTHARVLAVGPKFITLYLNDLAMERRIYLEGVDRLLVEWLELTGKLLLDFHARKSSKKRSTNAKFRPLEDVALVVNPAKEFSSAIKHETCNGIYQESGLKIGNRCGSAACCLNDDISSVGGIEPAAFPITLYPLTIIPVSVCAVGGERAAPDISVRLYASSYFR